jgi:DNA polymerase III subunit beta
VKFRCERDAFFEALSTAGRAVSSQRSGVPALGGVHVKAIGSEITLTGTDLDLTMSVTSSAVVTNEGSCVLPARLVADIVKSFQSGAVSVTVEDGEAQITSGRSQFSVRTYNADEFPKTPEPGTASTKLDASDLAAALKQVVRAASSDDSRPVLTGVLLSSTETGLRLVATDSYRLAIRDVAGTRIVPADRSVLVPSKALGELSRLLDNSEDTEVTLGESEIAFSTGSVRLVSRLIEGNFPDYQPLLPKNYPNRLQVERDVLLEAVRRVKLVVSDTTTPVRLALRADGIELTVVSQEIGHATEDIEAKYEGEPMTVAFNPAYLIDGLEVSKPGEVVIETVDALKPATITPATDNDFLYLIMPIRVS